MNYKHGTLIFGILLAIGILIAPTGTAEEAEFDSATVHLSPDCGCCVQHAQYLERAGVDVEVKEHDSIELNAIKEEHNIPQDYSSCHTTEIDEGWVIEGHVPVEIFNKVVEEEPNAEVIGLPGMPSGSPGMPGEKQGEWTFFEIEDGEIGEYTVL